MSIRESWNRWWKWSFSSWWPLVRAQGIVEMNIGRSARDCKMDRSAVQPACQPFDKIDDPSSGVLALVHTLYRS